MNIYAEIGSGWNQSYVARKYSLVFDPDMQAIKAALRSVASVTSWKDRDGKPFTPTPPPIPEPAIDTRTVESVSRLEDVRPL